MKVCLFESFLVFNLLHGVVAAFTTTSSLHSFSTTSSLPKVSSYHSVESINQYKNTRFSFLGTTTKTWPNISSSAGICGGRSSRTTLNVFDLEKVISDVGMPSFPWFSNSKERIKNSDQGAAVLKIKDQIASAISDTDRGRTTTEDQRGQIYQLLEQLESKCVLEEPARDARMDGPWVVEYTDAPPPSNGQLGFLKGVAKQVIDLEGKRYRNELYIGGDDNGNNKKNNADGDVDDDVWAAEKDSWLTAVLDASWCEWDGVYLDEEKVTAIPASTTTSDFDYGATTWKVTFETITLSLFKTPLFTQKFKEGTSRTWKMTYLDDDTRIVRAGRTGRGEDDWIFYMKRGKDFMT